MKNTPLVLLHGWNLPSDKYKPLSKQLKVLGFKVYIPDFPGFGKNKRLTKVLTLDDYQKFLIDYLQDNKLTKPVVIGHSFGGRVAILASSESEKLFSALILTGVPGLLPVSKFKVKLFLVIAKIGKLIFHLPFLNDFSDIARKILYRIAGSSDYYHTNGFLRQTFNNIIVEDLIEPMKKINIPTLLIWGKNDKIVPLPIAYKMQRIIKNSQLEVIRESGHQLPYQNYQIFADKIKNFLSKL